MELQRNKLRTASVWLDEWQLLAQDAVGKTRSLFSLGDISSRQDLRSTLKCHSFEWFLDNVFKFALGADPARWKMKATGGLQVAFL